ncbi:MAG: GtrA family protein [Actinobacteria bacterium]|nr:GtrA family protein [Actinomycetota bacterium]
MSARTSPRELPATRVRGVGAQVMLFVVVGCVAAVVDYLGYRSLLWSGLGVSPAKGMSFVLASVAAYCLNRRWTFRSAGGARQASAFAVLYALTFVINVGMNATLLALLPAAGWRLSAAWAVAGIAGSVVNFVALRTVVFGHGTASGIR